MSKERLEELKEKYFMYENYTGKVIMYHHVLEWLIEQAERVRELEEWQEKAQQLHESLKRQDEVLDRLRQQNKRYREALEFYALGRHWITSLKDGRDYVNEYGELAEKALEGEE